MTANYMCRMITTLKPYPAYKDSGMPWLGQVPEHWEVRRLKRIARLNPSKSEVPSALRDGQAVFLPMERVGSDGLFDVLEVWPISDLWNGFAYFRRGDVIVAKITPCFENGKGACLENLPTALEFGSTEFHVIRPSKAIVSVYLYCVTTLSEFRQPRTRLDALWGALVPLPPLEEQRRIVAHLKAVQEKVKALKEVQAATEAELQRLEEAILDRAFRGEL